jgi:arylsulfatase A-like enzyme
MKPTLFRNAGLLLCLGAPAVSISAQGTTPNIVHIFTDDLAWGSVGFNNASTYIQTPNLDALAAGGMILNRSYASTVCSPSRANLMTGTHNGHAINDRNGNIGAGLRAQDVTTGEVMQAAGYHTAIMGKWGWGASGSRTIGTGSDPLPSLGGDQAGDLPNNQGFDRFYGYLNHGAAHDFYYDWIWQTDAGGNMVLTPNDGGAGGGPEYMQDLVNLQSEQYIRDRAAQADPFYLQLNYTAVHFDIDAVATAPALRDLDGNVIAAAGKGVYLNDPTLDDKQENYAATITRMDASVGAIINRLKDPNGDGFEDDSILNNTLIMFSSDNGATPEDGMGASRINTFDIQGGLRGGKRDLYEGGIRMPAFAYWNGTIAAGTETDLLNDLADVQATAADLAGALPRVGIDGVSILPTLTGQGDQRMRQGLLFENDQNSQLGNPNTDWTIIVGDMKLIRMRDGSNQLYDLSIDMDENDPLDLVANATLVAELEALALAEGAGKADSYGTSYRDWNGSDGDDIASASSWQVTTSGGVNGSPDETWSALLSGASSGDATAHVTSDVQTLGIEVAGLNGNTQTLLVQQGASVSGRNEVRINTGGRLVLQDSALTSSRWVDVLPGGELAGQGVISGDLYNQGTLAPGQPNDVGFVAPLDPPATFTDSPSILLVFDFTGVQDNNGGGSAVGVPLTQTSTLDAGLTIKQGLQLGSGADYRHPADDPRPGTNLGEEYNINGFGELSLSSAISNADYIGYTVEPVNGLEMLLDEVSFSFWRNGVNAPENYAVLTSIDGFTDSAALASTSILHAQEGGPDQSSPATMTADYTGSTWVTELDVRLYGWQDSSKAGGETGNTHITAADLSGHFRLGGGTTSPTLDLTGTLQLNGNFYQYDNGTMQMELGGTDNTDPLNPQFDQLNVTGEVQLGGGTLSLSAVDGYSPQFGESVSIITSDALAGQFDTIIGVQSAGSDKFFAVTYNAIDVLVTIALGGDVNLDGEVSLLDLDLLGQNYGSAGGWAQGDFNGDGIVSLIDLDVLGQNYGNGSAPLSQAEALAYIGQSVPEPSSLALLGLGSLLIARRRR